MRNWKEDLKKFTDFLESLDIERYSYLRRIKTVEQDLPQELLPLDLYYEYYWNTTKFKDFEEVFEIYWKEKFNPHIREFIKNYFYGCSLGFVEEGFKARLYRIWMSILTQFQFQYLWNTLFDEELESSAELDKLGIDAVVTLNGKKVGMQIKKVSYRREASSRRFTKRQQKYVDVIVEIPYIVIDVNELKDKLRNPRVRKENKKRYKQILNLFGKNFNRLKNGFVIFNKDYLAHIHNIILLKTSKVKAKTKIEYNDILAI